MIDLENSISYSYGSIYNRRPDELYGMGKENLRISGRSSLQEFLNTIVNNSNIKFTNDFEYIIGTDEYIQNPEWTRFIGQPMFYIVDIEYQLEDNI